LEEMTERIGNLLDSLDRHHSDAGIRIKPEKLVDPGNLYPRQATAELVEELNFQKAVFDSVGVGILVVDRDARVMSANAMALEALRKPTGRCVEYQDYRCFSSKGRGRLVKALKKVARNLDLKRRTFYLESGSGALKLVVSLLRMGNELDGWILTMEDMTHESNKYQK
jgi:PAS domain-containing protein